MNTNYQMPDLLSVGLGGGSKVYQENVGNLINSLKSRALVSKQIWLKKETKKLWSHAQKFAYLFKCYCDQKITLNFSSDIETLFTKHSPCEFLVRYCEKNDKGPQEALRVDHSKSWETRAVVHKSTRFLSLSFSGMAGDLEFSPVHEDRNGACNIITTGFFFKLPIAK